MHSRILMTLLNITLLGCQDFVEISKDNRVLAAQIQSDIDGIVTAAVDTNSGSAVVGASSSSNISGASVLFPSGSLTLSTSIIVEEGSSIANSAFMSTVNESAAASLTEASSAVSVSSSTAQDAASPFSISLPITGLGLNLTEETSHIVVLFKVFKASEGKYYSGIIPTNQLTISSTTVQFTTLNFGVYQAAITKTAITERSEQVSDTSILTKAQEQKLATVTWQRPSFTYNDSQRTLAASVTATNLQDPRDCIIILDKDKVQTWDYVRRASSNMLSSLKIPIDSTLSGDFYVAVSCMDKHGRISRSLWSDARVSIQTSAVGSGFAITQKTPAPGATLSNLQPSIEVTFNNNLNSSSVSTTSILLKNAHTKRHIPILIQSVMDNKLIFKPEISLALNGRYIVSLGSSLKDVTGTSLTAQEWDFYTNKVVTYTDMPEATPSTTPPSQTKVFDLGNNTFLQLFKDGNSLKSTYFNGSEWQTSTSIDSTSNLTEGTINYEAHLMPDKSILLICACNETLPSLLSPLRSYVGNLNGSSWSWGSGTVLSSNIAVDSINMNGVFKSQLIPNAGVAIMYEAKPLTSYIMKMNFFKNGTWQTEQDLGSSSSIAANLIDIDFFQDHLMFAWHRDNSGSTINVNKFQLGEAIPTATTISPAEIPTDMKAFLDPNLGQTVFVSSSASFNVTSHYMANEETEFAATSLPPNYSGLNIIKKPDGRLILLSNESSSSSKLTAHTIKNGEFLSDLNFDLQPQVSDMFVKNVEVHQGLKFDWVIATFHTSTPYPGSNVVKVWKHQADIWNGPFAAFSITSSDSMVHTRYGHDEFDNFLMYSSFDNGSSTDWSKSYFNQLTGIFTVIPAVVSLPYTAIEAPCSIAVRPTGESIMTCFSESGNLTGEIRH